MKTRRLQIPLGFILFLLFISCGTSDDANLSNAKAQSVDALDSILTPISIIEAALSNQSSDISVTVEGSIINILSDDTSGDNHQRFIIQLSNKQTILIVHNIDIAPRIPDITVSADIYVHGDYVWNSQGGLIHWTHHDPEGLHENGWIIFKDVKYD